MQNMGRSCVPVLLVVICMIIVATLLVVSNLQGSTVAIDILPAGQSQAVNSALDQAAQVCGTTDLCNTDSRLPGLWTKFWGLFDY